MNLISNAGTYLAANVISPLWADLSGGLAYSIALVNQTDADITDGTFTIQTARPLSTNPCLPDDATWTDLLVEPSCDDLPGVVVGPASITLTSDAPLRVNSQCHIAAPCPNSFIRVAVTGGGAGVEAIAVLSRLRGTANI